MKPTLLMTAAVLLACVAYSQQMAIVADVSDEVGGGSVPSAGQLQQQKANALRADPSLIDNSDATEIGKSIYNDFLKPVLENEIIDEIAEAALLVGL